MIARGLRYAESQGRLRVRLGGLLTAEHYASLVRADGLQRMLADLRTTSYAPVAELAEPAATSFADRLHRRHLAAAERTTGGLPPPARKLCRAFLGRFTVDALKVILRTAGRGIGREQRIRLLGPLPDSDLPLELLIGAATVEDFLAALSQTPYAAPLEAVVSRRTANHPSPPMPSDLLSHFELELDRWFFERLWLASRSLPAADARIALRLVGVLADVTNVLWVERLRGTFRLSPEEVERHLIPHGFYLTDRKRRMLALGEASSAFAFPFASEKAAADLPLRLARLLHREASKPLRMAPFQAGLPLAYLMLAEMEVRDLVTLYEGKLWSVAPHTLAGRLVRFRRDEVMH